MQQAFIIDGLRTPIGKFRGSLSTVRADDLAAEVIRALMQRFENIPPTAVNDVILGCANQAGEDNRNIARMAALLAGLPVNVPGETVNRLCASGMSACVHAARAIACGDGDLFIAGGVEHMTRAPYVMSKSALPYGNDAQLYDSSFGWRFINPKMKADYGTEAMGETAENLQQLHQISREDQDAFALRSQQKAAAAQQSGRLANEIVPINISVGKNEIQQFDTDEFVKAGTTMEALAKLRPVFKNDGTVTAGNASGLNDGAAALLIAGEEACKKYGLQPKAKIVASAVVGVEPRIMGIGPVEATKQALDKAGLSLKDIDLIEINEAFAAQALACTRSLGIDDKDERINVNGGAIALGHPLGMSGARLLLTAATELRERQQQYALCTMCVGVGQGYAVVLQRF